MIIGEKMATKLGNEQKELAAVYYVCSRLALEGYISYVFSRKMKRVDMMVYNPVTDKTIALQIKSAFHEQDVEIASYDDETDFEKRTDKLPFHNIVRFGKTPDMKHVKCYLLTGKETKSALRESFDNWRFGAKHRKPMEKMKIWSRLGIHRSILDRHEDKWEKIRNELE
jgi:hypothetical protein